MRLCSNCGRKHLDRFCTHKAPTAPLRPPPSGAGAGRFDPAKNNIPTPAAVAAPTHAPAPRPSAPAVSWAPTAAATPALAAYADFHLPDTVRDFPKVFPEEIYQYASSVPVDVDPSVQAFMDQACSPAYAAVATDEADDFEAPYMPSGYGASSHTPYAPLSPP
jgi:hypothetical protein